MSLFEDDDGRDHLNEIEVTGGKKAYRKGKIITTKISTQPDTELDDPIQRYGDGKPVRVNGDYVVKLSDFQRIRLEAEVAQLTATKVAYEQYSHEATPFYKTIVSALESKKKRLDQLNEGSRDG